MRNMGILLVSACILALNFLLYNTYAIVEFEEDWTYAIQSNDSIKDEVDGISIDNEGNILMGGLFHSNVKFGSITRSAKTGSDMFIQKLSPEGELIWFKQIDSGSNDFLWDITTDNNNDVLISGGYGGKIYDNVNNKTYYAWRDGSAFFAKLDGESGEFIWIQTAGVVYKSERNIDADTTAGGNEIKVDSNNNVIITLTASGEEYIIFGERGYQKQGYSDSFIVKLNASGNKVWDHQFGGDGAKRLRALGISANDDVIFGHEFKGGITDSVENPQYSFYSPNTRFPNGTFGLLDKNNGNTLWMREVSGEGFVNIRGAGGTEDGYIYVTGVIQENAKIIEETGKSYNIIGNANGATMLAKYNSKGELSWIRVLGNTQEDNAGELSVMHNHVMISGSNKGGNYHLYNNDGKVLQENIHSGDSINTRATVTIFNSGGNVVGKTGLLNTDWSSAGVLEYNGGDCFVYQTSFSGDITFNNKDSYTTIFKKDKDATIVKSCLPKLLKDEYISEKLGSIAYNLDGDAGLILCFHGTGGRGENWNKGYKQDYLKYLSENNYSYLCPSSYEKTWSNENNSDNNDVLKVDTLLNAYRVANDTPIYLVGHSNGAGFASRYSVFSERSSNIEKIHYSNASGLPKILSTREYSYPSIFTYATCDPIVDYKKVENSNEILQAKTPKVETSLKELSLYYTPLIKNGSVESCHEFIDTSKYVLDFFQ